MPQEMPQFVSWQHRPTLGVTKRSMQACDASH